MALTDQEKIIRAMVRAGFCSRCRRRREPEMKHARRCVKCNSYHRHYNAKVEQDEVVTLALPYAAIIRCAGCQKKFQSTDRRSVRKCDDCRYRQFQSADLYACAEAIYAP